MKTHYYRTVYSLYVFLLPVFLWKCDFYISVSQAESCATNPLMLLHLVDSWWRLVKVMNYK